MSHLVSHLDRGYLGSDPTIATPDLPTQAPAVPAPVMVSKTTSLITIILAAAAVWFILTRLKGK